MIWNWSRKILNENFHRHEDTFNPFRVEPSLPNFLLAFYSSFNLHKYKKLNPSHDRRFNGAELREDATTPSPHIFQLIFFTHRWTSRTVKEKEHGEVDEHKKDIITTQVRSE